MIFRESYRVVILDDDEGFARTLQVFLEDSGAETVIFTDPVEGLDYIFKNPLDLLLLDLKMPKMNGHEVLKKFRSFNELVSIIIVSATGEVSEAVTAIREGADEFVAKPIRDLDEFEIIINKTIEKSRLRKQLEEYRLHLEELVKERTTELIETNERLTEEVKRRKRAEQAVKKGTVNFMTAVEIGRKRIAKELHDSIGQKLVFTRMNIELGLNESAVANEHFTLALQNIDMVSSEIRELVKTLYPISLEKYSLEENIRALVDSFTRNTGIETKFYNSGEEGKINKDTKLHLYRIFQESLNNIVKHAQADMVEVNINFFAHAVSGSITDNGKGFQVSGDANFSGTGLFSIKERIEEMDGRITIASHRNSGTKITFEVPV